MKKIMREICSFMNNNGLYYKKKKYLFLHASIHFKV
jgi:hypothetical protein